MDNLIQDTPIEEKSADESNEVVSETVKSFLGDTDFNEEPIDTPTSEEKPQEDTVLNEETPKEEPQEPEIPLEEIVEEVKTKTKEETKQEILKALGMTEQEKEVAEEAGYKFPWEARGEEAPKDWKEVIDASLEYQEYKRQEYQKEQYEAQRQELAIMQEREAQINTEWDTQLEYLREEGLIPEISPEIKAKLDEGKVLTKAERTDPGLKAQADIFEKMYEVSQEREKQGLSPITDVVHIYSRYYKPTKPAGMDAPVSGGSVPISSNEDEDITYEQLRNSDFTDLVR